jgi:hypothetical protein
MALTKRGHLLIMFRKSGACICTVSHDTPGLKWGISVGREYGPIALHDMSTAKDNVFAVL